MSLAPVMDSFVLFGDSITQGGWESGAFAQKLAEVYSRKIDIINRGYGGYTTDWAVPIFEQIFRKRPYDETTPKCKLLTIWFGANDSVFEGGKQHVPIQKFKENLKWMVQSIRSESSQYYAPSTRIILFTPPPIHEGLWLEFLESRDPPVAMDRKWEITQSYAEAVKDVSKELGVSVVDTWDLIWKAAGEKTEALPMFLSDGLHLTKEAYEIVFAELIKVITRDYPQIHYDNLPMVFPSWDAVDEKDPSSSVIRTYIDV